MDVHRFDVLVRQMGQEGTRRHLLGVFSGTALGGLVVATCGEGAEGKKKKKKSCQKTCGECQTCKKGKCLAKPDGAACTGGTCEGGFCRTVNNCPPAQVCGLSESCCTQGINETCSASHDFCEMEWATCGNGCGCVSSVEGANTGASCADFECPASSECANDTQCVGDDVCVNVGCRCGGGTLGMCLSLCPADRQGAAAARSANPRRRLPGDSLR